jgi:hypothetical protein
LQTKGIESKFLTFPDENHVCDLFDLLFKNAY